MTADGRNCIRAFPRIPARLKPELARPSIKAVNLGVVNPVLFRCHHARQAWWLVVYGTRDLGLWQRDEGLRRVQTGGSPASNNYA